MTTPLEWDLNLRGNLVLWPAVSPNIRVLAGFDGVPYNEPTFLDAMKRPEGKAPTDPRAVRQSFEILAISGLAYRDEQNCLRLTQLGRCLMSFLGVTGDRTFIGPANRHLAAALLVRAVADVAEVQAIWRLWLYSGGHLSKEELNRGMGAMTTLEDAESAASLVRESRELGDVTRIGPRAYDDAAYHAGPDAAAQQRRAMWPQLLLASAGGLLFAEQVEGSHRLTDVGVRLLSSATRRSGPFARATTSADHALNASRRAMPPRCD